MLADGYNYTATTWFSSCHFQLVQSGGRTAFAAVEYVVPFSLPVSFAALGTVFAAVSVFLFVSFSSLDGGWPAVVADAPLSFLPHHVLQPFW